MQEQQDLAKDSNQENGVEIQVQDVIKNINVFERENNDNFLGDEAMKKYSL